MQGGAVDQRRAVCSEVIGEEIREQVGFLERVGAAGGDGVRPMAQALPGILDRRGQREMRETLPDDLRMEERFGFDGH